MARPGTNLLKRMQLRRPRASKEPIPCIGTKPRDAGKARFDIAKRNGAHERGQIPAERAQGRAVIRARL